MRKDWVAPAGGFEAGYSWIEGYNVALRVGARRPETTTEQPVHVRRGVHGRSAHDRIRASQFFDGGHTAHGVTSDGDDAAGLARDRRSLAGRRRLLAGAAS